MGLFYRALVEQEDTEAAAGRTRWQHESEWGVQDGSTNPCGENKMAWICSVGQAGRC